MNTFPIMSYGRHSSDVWDFTRPIFHGTGNVQVWLHAWPQYSRFTISSPDLHIAHRRHSRDYAVFCTVVLCAKRHQNSREPLPLLHCNHVCDCIVQCANGTGNREMTVIPGLLKDHVAGPRMVILTVTSLTSGSGLGVDYSTSEISINEVLHFRFCGEVML